MCNEDEGGTAATVPHPPHDMNTRAYKALEGMRVRMYTHQKGLGLKLLFSFLLIP